MQFNCSFNKFYGLFMVASDVFVSTMTRFWWSGLKLTMVHYGVNWMEVLDNLGRTHGMDPFLENIFTPCQRSCGKVMFSLVSVYSQGCVVPMWPLPMMHWTLLYRCPWTSDMGTPLPPNIRHTTTNTDIWLPLTPIWLASGWYASYWNVFLIVEIPHHRTYM